MPPFEILALDADDTLWHNERLYVEAQNRFAQILSHYHDETWIRERLYQTEIANLAHFGYGIKAFALSMIETAVELTEGRVTGEDIRQLLQIVRGMLSAEVELLPQVAQAIPLLAQRYPLMLITKGDLFDQERKINLSGLTEHFRYIEVVSEKDRATYARLLKKHRVRPERFMMVGNSLRSDILPILELGGSAVYIPYTVTWTHERAEIPSGQVGFYQLEHLGQLVKLLKDIEGG